MVAQFTSTKFPDDLPPMFLQFVNSPGQLRFAGAGRPHQQDRRLGSDRHLFDLLDQPVEPVVPRLDSPFEQ